MKPHPKTPYQQQLAQLGKDRQREARNRKTRERRWNARPEVRRAKQQALARSVQSLRAARRAEMPRLENVLSVKDVAAVLAGEGYSLRAIASELEHMGIRTPRGSVWWTATQVERELQRRQIGDVAADLPPIINRGYRGKVSIARKPRRRTGEALEYETLKWRTTEGEAARTAWATAAEALPADQPRPKEPLLDSRGRVRKGRRFSKIKRPAP